MYGYNEIIDILLPLFVREDELLYAFENVHFDANLFKQICSMLPNISNETLVKLIIKCCRASDVEIFEYLLDRYGKDVLKFIDVEGDNLITYCSSPLIIKILLANGVNVNHQNNEGETPLHYMVERNDEELVKLLLDYGADKNIKNNNNMTSLDAAYDYNHYEVVDILENYDDCLNTKEPGIL